MKTKKQRVKKNNGKERRSRKEASKYWVAVGTMGVMVAYSALTGRSNNLLFADEAKNTPGSKNPRNSVQALSVRSFQIAPGMLDSVLKQFEKITSITTVVPNESILDIYSPGASGMFTNEQALKEILMGTGVSYRFTRPQTIQLQISGPDASVEVTGPMATISSPKYQEPLRDVPQTITVIPKTVIEEQGAASLQDVLRNVPGLTMSAGEGGTPAGDNLTLRGFSARNDVFVDGVRDIGPQSRDTFNLEQVEVVKGPDSLYTGRGSAGGSINLVSKAPGIDSTYGGTLSIGNAETKRVTADLNAPIKALGDSVAFRLNVMGHDSDAPGRGVVKNQRWGFAPSLGIGLGTPTRFTASYFHLTQDNISDYGIPWVTATNNVLADFRDRPAPVPRDTFYGFLSRDHEDLRSDIGTLRFEKDYNVAMSLRTQLRYGYSERDSLATPPRFASDDSTVINREMRSWITQDDVWDSQTDLTTRFSTGEINHALVTGLSLSWEDNIRKTRTAPNSPTTLLNPNPNDTYLLPITLSPIVGDVTGKSYAIYAMDTVKLGQKWELNGGIRWDYFDVNGVTTVGLPIARIDRAVSYRAGAVWKPVEIGSIYAVYGTSFNPSLEGLSYQVANAAIEPEKSYTFEIGNKWELMDQKILFSGAVFRVEKTNARTPGILPDDPPQVLEGRQRVDGVELGAAGRLSSSWELYTAYTFLHSEIVESNVPAEVGKHLQNTPANSFNVWTTYELPWKLSIGGGVRYVGRRYGNNINTRYVDPYWLLDGLIAYPVAKYIDLRLNLYNMTDEYYFDRLGGGHVVPGAGRSVLLSAGLQY